MRFVFYKEGGGCIGKRMRQDKKRGERGNRRNQRFLKKSVDNGGKVWYSKQAV